MFKRLLLFGILALAALAAFFFLREPDPQAVVRQATKNLAAEKTFRLDVRATMVGMPKDFGGVVADATGVDVVFRSDIDRTDPTRQASVSTFEFRQGLAGGGQAVVKGEARRKDGLQYVRLQEIAGLEGFDQAKLANVWMKSDRPFLDLVLGAGTSDPPLDAARYETMKSALQSVDLCTVVQTLPKDTINGRKMFHYSVEMNMEAVSALLLKRRELQAGRQIGAEDVLAVTNELMQWNKPVGEIWIDAKTRAFKQITLGTSLGRDGKSGAAAGTLAFSREGAPVSVEAPPAEDVEKILGPLFGKRLSLAGERFVASSASSSRAAAETALASLPEVSVGAADGDGDGLADLQEFFYGTDVWNPDTDADGYPDGFEVEKGMNPAGPGPLFGFGL